MWLEVRKKNYHECDQAQEQVAQNIKKPNVYTSVANASFVQQMSPSIEHIFLCLAGHSVFGDSPWNTQQV